MIRHMVGLAIAVVSGAVPASYCELALSSDYRERVELPLAPGGNLVLARCSFRDGQFAATVDGLGAQKTNVGELQEGEKQLRADLVGWIAAETAQASFEEFVGQLRTVVAPRMRTKLLAVQEGTDRVSAE
jgi:hypothetical protein